VKSQRIIAFLIAAVLTIPAAAQAPATGTAGAQQQSPDANSHPDENSSSTGHTITVDVWSSAAPSPTSPSEAETARLSRNFAAAGLNAAFNMESTEREIENSLRRGFPLGESWIRDDLAQIDNSLRVAELSVANDSDREALQQLQQQSKRLRAWSNWLIEQNKMLALTEYYISSSTLDNDDRFQNSVACTRYLVSMLASRRLAENSSCL